jgi:hypothetical protein
VVFADGPWEAFRDEALSEPTTNEDRNAFRPAVQGLDRPGRRGTHPTAGRFSDSPTVVFGRAEDGSLMPESRIRCTTAFFRARA